MLALETGDIFGGDYNYKLPVRSTAATMKIENEGKDKNKRKRKNQKQNGEKRPKSSVDCFEP